MIQRPRSENCFYCTTSDLGLEEISKYILSVIEDVEGEIVRRCNAYIPNCKFSINLPLKGNATQRHCYLWVTNKEVYRMLTGLNYDGTKIEEGNTSEVSLTPLEMLRRLDWAHTSTSEYTKYVLPYHEHIKLTPVVVERVSADFIDGKLFCMTSLPDSYPTNRLNVLFAPFVTSGTVTVVRSKRAATITFSHKDDAYFALCMMRKTKDGDQELAFNYCRAR